jgi:hypothetical protein
MKALPSIHLKGIYAGVGYEKPHHLFTDVVQIENGHEKPYRDKHCWLNAEFSGFPDGIPHGTRVSFWCSYHPRPGGRKLTEARNIIIIEEASE